MNRQLLTLALGLSPLALATAHAANKADPCGPKTCQRRPADSATEPTPITPNLEQGGAYDPFRVTIDGQTPAGTWPVEGDAQRATDKALADADVQVQVTTLRAQPVLSLVPDAPATAPGDAVTFYSFANYGFYITHAELRLFPANVSTERNQSSSVPCAGDAMRCWSPRASNASSSPR